jgi:transposase
MEEGGFVVRASHKGSERQRMQEPEDVRIMLGLYSQGWGSRRIGRELGVSRNTVKRYVNAGGYLPYGGIGGRAKSLDGMESWLEQRFHQHRGNADVLRQELEREKNLRVSLRTVERAVKAERTKLTAQQLATVRFETPPGKQLQADFGQVTVPIAGEKVKLHACVLTLGYSRRPYVEVFDNEQIDSWLRAMEASFRHFGGIPEEILIDNARALVTLHNAQTREVLFSPSFSAFARYWGFRPLACAPYRARTKGKDERGVGYLKRNAIAGHSFPSLQSLRAHLDWWMREVADVRVHGTTGERPIDRFSVEAAALKPVNGRPPFQQNRDLVRRVHGDLCIELDSNAYSVPWRYIGQEVSVLVRQQEIIISHAGAEIARHARLWGRKERSVDNEHFAGVKARVCEVAAAAEGDAELLRPLAEYQQVVGGSW